MTTDFAMLDITDNAMMIVNAGKDFGATDESPARDEVKSKTIMQPAQGISLAIGIGSQPNIGHAATIDQFL